MKPLHFWQKRPVYESRLSYYIRLPIVHWLWRRGILHRDGPLQREGPFYMTGHTPIGGDPGHGYMDWERKQSEEFQLAARKRRYQKGRSCQ